MYKRQVSYCAICDGSFYRGKSVAVLGGGDTALDDAVYLPDVAEKVYVIHRRKEFRGAAVTVAKLREKGFRAEKDREQEEKTEINKLSPG